MDCKRMKEVLLAYLDNEVTPEEGEKIRLHLSGCPACQRELEALTITRRLMHGALVIRAENTMPSTQVWTRIQERLSEEQKLSLWDKLAVKIREPAWQAAMAFVLVLAWSLMAMVGTGIIPAIHRESTAVQAPTIIVEIPSNSYPTTITVAPTVPQTAYGTQIPPVVVTQVPAPEITLQIPASPSPVQVIPNYLLWALLFGIIAVGCLAVVLVWISRHRRHR